MRILTATDQWWPDATGGSARVVRDTAVALAARGHDLTILAPSADRRSVEHESGVTVQRVLARSRLPQTLTDVAETARAARRLARNHDVLLAHQSTNATGLLAAHLGLPLALVFHASAGSELRFLRARLATRRARAAASALEPALLLFERLAARHADRVLVLSEFSRSLFIGQHPDAADAVRLVTGGVDVDAFAPGDGPKDARRRLGVDPEQPLLFTVRRLEPRMGIENLIRALPAVRRKVPATLAIGGAGPLRPDLERLAGELGLGGCVRFLGRVPDEELVDWYRAADVFVLPTVAYEGFGMVTVEALAAGTPVLGTPVGATPELLAPLDLRLVASGVEPEQLAEGLVQVLALAGPELRARCREYACANYAWTTVVERWEAALVELASPAAAVRPQLKRAAATGRKAEEC